MKWEEITTRATETVEEALNALLNKEEVQQEEARNSLTERLQDADYIAGKIRNRKRYCGQEAFLRMKRQESRKKRIRYFLPAGVAACFMVACGLLWFFRSAPEPLPVAGCSQTEAQLRPAEMKAVLVKADGQQVVLGKQTRQLQEKNGVMIVADSAGLEYTPSPTTGIRTVANNTLIVPRGGMYLLTLSDGTRVWLNAGSRLEYPVVFSDKERKVKLSGEAYFEVVKNTAAPFIVKTDLGRVKVLGTAFNVKCYPEESAIATTLVSGKVCFSNELLDDAFLEPGQQICYGKGAAQAIVRQVNVSHYIGWKENLLYFQCETLENIMRILSRWYDIQVVFEDDKLKQLVFSGNLDKFTDIGTFFYLFEMGADVQFEIKDRVVYVRMKK